VPSHYHRQAATPGEQLQDGGSRRFILVECEDYADRITAERLRRVIAGVPKSNDDALRDALRDGLAGSFIFYTLGEEINLDGLLKGSQLPDYRSLAQYVFYTATGRTLDTVAKAGADYFIGETDLYRVHLIYKPDREFLRSNDSALNAGMVERIAKGNKDGKRALVFATAKFMGQRELTELRMEFCRLPYAIHRVLGG
jgi:adenine-specific DNA-methyltransferase